jgi:hypothetical protein
MDHAQLPGRGLLKGGYLLAKDKLLGLKHMLDGRQQLPVHRLVLAFQIKHGHGLDGTVGRGCSLLHGDILSTMEPVAHPWAGFENKAKFNLDEKRG